MKIFKKIVIVLALIALIIMPIIPIKYNPLPECIVTIDGRGCPTYRWVNILGLVMHQIQPNSEVWKY